MIKKCVQIFAKEINYRHFVDDSLEIPEFFEKFIKNLQKLKKKNGYLVLEDGNNIAAIKVTEINSFCISPDAPKIEQNNENIPQNNS